MSRVRNPRVNVMLFIIVFLLSVSKTSHAGKGMDPEALRKLEAQIEAEQRRMKDTKPYIMPQAKRQASTSYGESCLAKVREQANKTVFRPSEFGTVLVEVFIREDGKLHKAELFRSSGNKDLDAKVMRLIEMSAPFSQATMESIEPRIANSTQIMQYDWKFHRTRTNTMDSQIQLSLATEEDLKYPE